MNNKQRAAARRAMGAFSALRPNLSQDEAGNDVVTPYLIASPAIRGESVTIHDGMSERDIETLLKASCKAIASG